MTESNKISVRAPNDVVKWAPAVRSARFNLWVCVLSVPVIGISMDGQFESRDCYEEKPEGHP